MSESRIVEFESEMRLILRSNAYNQLADMIEEPDERKRNVLQVESAKKMRAIFRLIKRKLRFSMRELSLAKEEKMEFYRVVRRCLPAFVKFYQIKFGRKEMRT